MEEYLAAISQVGFPIAISVYLLIRFESKIEKLDDSINDLCNQIKELKEKLK